MNAVKRNFTPPRKKAHDDALAAGASPDEADAQGEEAVDTARKRRKWIARVGTGVRAIRRTTTRPLTTSATNRPSHPRNREEVGRGSA